MIGSRRKSRILAFQAVYSWDFNNENAGNLNKFDWLDNENEIIKPETRLFASLLLNGTIDNISIIDKTIKKHINKWKIERINKINL